ncbi:MAG: AsmA family protein, partial [Cytophagales bacterium]|nr:AsmA family protein [Rhizobacter sp.]
ITQMELVDADISLERQADGLRNWRLTRPDDRGPARMRVLSLQTLRSQIHVVHQGVGLTMEAASSPLPQSEGELTQRITFSGRYHDAPFAGEALAGPVLSLQRTGNFFALRGQARSAQTVLQVDGRVADLMKLGGLDAQLQLSGPSLGQLKPFFPTQPWPNSKPYQAEARVTRQGDAFTVRALKARLGSSDLAGEVRYDKKDERAAVNATLNSERIVLLDLLSLASNSAPASTPPSQRLLPQTALNLAPLNEVDATVELTAKTLQAPPVPTLKGLRARATLHHGVLQVALQDSGLAGGRVSAQFALDNRPQTPSVNVDMRARGLRLEQLWHDMPAPAGVEGPLNGQLKLKGQGRSVAAWLGSATGQLGLTTEGGNLSMRLDAKLGLNAGKLMRSFFTGDKPVPLRCGALNITFLNGTGTTRKLVLDTAQTHIEGEGSLRLREETWALLLTPRAHKPTLLSLDGSLLAQGTFRGFSYKLDGNKQPGKAANGACSTP